MKSFVWGLVLGYLAIGAVSPVVAQTANNKITAAGFGICLDFPTKDVALTLKIDGATTAIAATGVTWAGAGPFTATIPIAGFPASARTVGDHSVIVSAPDVVETLADNSTVTVQSLPVTVTYRVVSVTGQGFANVKLIRVTGGSPAPATGAKKR